MILWSFRIVPILSYMPCYEAVSVYKRICVCVYVTPLTFKKSLCFRKSFGLPLWHFTTQTLSRCAWANTPLIAREEALLYSPHIRSTSAGFSWEGSCSAWNLKRRSHRRWWCNCANPLLLRALGTVHLTDARASNLFSFSLYVIKYSFDYSSPHWTYICCICAVWWKELVWIHCWTEYGLLPNFSVSPLCLSVSVTLSSLCMSCSHLLAHFHPFSLPRFLC